MENMMIALIVTPVAGVHSPHYEGPRSQTLRTGEYMESEPSPSGAVICGDSPTMLNFNALAPVIVQYTLGTVT